MYVASLVILSASFSMTFSSPMDEFLIPKLLSFCYHNVHNCLASKRWLTKSCDEGCKCRGYYRGACEYNRDECGPEAPYGCHCTGQWFGRPPPFCYQYFLQPFIRGRKY